MPLFLAFALVFLNTEAHATDDNEWHLWRHKYQVSVYKQMTPSGYLRIKARTRVKANIGALINLLDDISQVPAWLQHASQVKLLARPSLQERIVYTRFDAPWPVSPRDLVSCSRYWQDPQRQLFLAIESCNDNYPPQPDSVRMPVVKALWRVVPQDDGTVIIEYIAYAEAGGSLPHWLANSAALSAVLKTFRQLRRHIRQDKYQAPVKGLIYSY